MLFLSRRNARCLYLIFAYYGFVSTVFFPTVCVFLMSWVNNEIVTFFGYFLHII